MTGLDSAQLGDQTGGDAFTTSPPEEPIQGSALKRLRVRIVGRVSLAILPIVKRVASPYLGGATVDEAMAVATRLAREGYGSTPGYWDLGRETGREVADIGLDIIHRLSGAGFDSYVSLKPPALRFSSVFAGELAAAAAEHGLRLHFDSHGPNAVDRHNAMLEAMRAKLGGERLGTTLPGRWRRSLRDADWAVERGLNVRVVKGQWPDPEDPKRDMSSGFLAVVDRLAARARHVSVATQDFALARESIGRLRTAGTPCDIEVLLGLASPPMMNWARENGIAVRIYVPYGAGFIPNAAGVLKRNPRLALVVANGYLRIAGNFVKAALAPKH